MTDSIRHGWRFVRENVGDVILLIILLVVLSMLFGGLVSVITLPLSLLAFGPVFVDLFRGVALQTGDLVFAGIGLIALMLVGALLNAIFIAFRSVTVTLAYQDLRGKSTGKMVSETL